MPLPPRIRFVVGELEKAIQDGSPYQAVEVVRCWGLSRSDRLAVARELDRRANFHNDDEDVELIFDRFERARVRRLADVWTAAR
jgi:hypothetical protein